MVKEDLARSMLGTRIGIRSGLGPNVPERRLRGDRALRALGGVELDRSF